MVVEEEEEGGEEEEEGSLEGKKHTRMQVWRRLAEVCCGRDRLMAPVACA